ncbi:MAG TPA: SpoIIE family protein phosphatase [Thermoanaerobaculia bacterium]|nr:SpoIIE family protein phosphatase [Thermoanaerobaculia bacterium]
MSDSQPKKRRLPIAFVAWISAIVAVIVIDRLDAILRRFGADVEILEFFTFLAWLVVIALTLYGVAIAVRFLLRKLFWTVGRRLFLSYVLIGLLPFFLFAILLAAILYVIAGVASQANFKAERQASIGQMESWIAEYALQGKVPKDPDVTVEIYDSTKPSGRSIPSWLRGTNFSGMVLRNEKAALVVARQYPDDSGVRSIVMVEPLDVRWARSLEERKGMVVWQQIGSREGDNIRVRAGEQDEEQESFDFAGRAFPIDELLLFRRVIFFDITEEGGLLDWESGRARAGKRLFTLISNPTRNLLQFYFGGATNSQIMRGIFGSIVGLTTLLMIVYLFASAFAAVLIFSISRAVNRIEKGTQAVERGDFSYRINMKRDNQLGAMAQSFDHMTESIASLLASVAEKERLQSEIEIAATIQRNLLPKEGPQFRGVSFSAHFEPTASIGGDYYDVFNLDKSRLAVAIGDVSGHGLSTGLVMAMVKAAITTLVEEGTDEATLFQRLNDLVFRSTERRAFMTLAFTIFDLERGTIRHTNAGHLYPYLLREGRQPAAIEVPSLPLGVRHTISTRTAELALEEGDTVVYLSDGIIEAQDDHGEPFGFDQLETLLKQQTERSPSIIRDTILGAVERHSANRAADDDRTVMILRFDTLRPLGAAESERELVSPASS